MKYEKPMIRTLDSSEVLEFLGPASALSSGSDLLVGGATPTSTSSSGSGSTMGRF